MPRSRTIPAVPLGSLTQPGTHRGLCRQCGSDRVTEITMTLADQSEVSFAHCVACESQEWTGGGVTLPRERVLAKATTRR